MTDSTAVLYCRGQGKRFTSAPKLAPICSTWRNHGIESTITVSSNSRWVILVPETRKFYWKSSSYFFCLVPRLAVWYRPWLSGTGCLAFPFVLLFIYVSNYDVTMQNATFPATSESCRDVKENIFGIFLFKMHISRRYKKNNQVPMLNPDDKSQSRVIRCHIPVSATTSTGICDIVSPSTEICQSGSNTWFFKPQHGNSHRSTPPWEIMVASQP